MDADAADEENRLAAANEMVRLLGGLPLALFLAGCRSWRSAASTPASLPPGWR